MPRVIDANTIFVDRQIHFHQIRSLAEASEPHTHTFFEIFLLLSGEMRHLINGESSILHSHTVVLIRPQDTHGFQSVGDADCSFFNLAFSSTMMREVCAFLGQGFSPEAFMAKPSCFVAQISDSFCELTRQIYQEYRLRSPSESADGWAKLLIALLLERCFPPINQHKEIPQWFLQLEEKMRQPEVFINGVQKLAELCGKTPEHICRSFRKYRSVTPQKVLAKLRLIYASNLLLTTSMSILDISLECGYASLSHFYNLFHTTYGISPAAYRNQYRVL